MFSSFMPTHTFLSYILTNYNQNDIDRFSEVFSSFCHAKHIRKKTLKIVPLEYGYWLYKIEIKCNSRRFSELVAILSDAMEKIGIQYANVSELPEISELVKKPKFPKLPDLTDLF